MDYKDELFSEPKYLKITILTKQVCFVNKQIEGGKGI